MIGPHYKIQYCFTIDEIEDITNTSDNQSFLIIILESVRHNLYRKSTEYKLEWMLNRSFTVCSIFSSKSF